MLDITHNDRRNNMWIGQRSNAIWLVSDAKNMKRFRAGMKEIRNQLKKEY